MTKYNKPCQGSSCSNDGIAVGNFIRIYDGDNDKTFWDYCVTCGQEVVSESELYDETPVEWEMKDDDGFTGDAGGSANKPPTKGPPHLNVGKSLDDLEVVETQEVLDSDGRLHSKVNVGSVHSLFRSE